ncbi:hypothetical protein ACFLYC_02920 [Chloroflexota bacterium]
MIEYDKPDYNWINLTSKGFDVALQNQSADRTTQFSKIAIFLSAAIAIAAVANLLLGIDNVVLKWAVTVIISLGFISIGWMIIRI